MAVDISKSQSAHLTEFLTNTNYELVKGFLDQAEAMANKVGKRAAAASWLWYVLQDSLLLLVCPNPTNYLTMRNQHCSRVKIHSLEFPGPVNQEFFSGVVLECDKTVDPLLPGHFRPSAESYVVVMLPAKRPSTLNRMCTYCADTTTIACSGSCCTCVTIPQAQWRRRSRTCASR